jgi:hypothetical protein
VTAVEPRGDTFSYTIISPDSISMKHFEENIGLAEEPIDNEGTPIAPMFVV